jgi:dTDP-4-amino-4,6-dideoxygalactose transaminase
MLVLVGGVVPFRLNELVKICKKKNIPLILDAAHGVDTLYKNKHISH